VLEASKEKADARLVRSPYERVVGYSYEAVEIVTIDKAVARYWVFCAIA
jgi:hypothetical protein